jgi:hypothetical protein
VVKDQRNSDVRQFKLIFSSGNETLINAKDIHIKYNSVAFTYRTGKTRCYYRKQIKEIHEIIAGTQTTNTK